MKYFIVYYIKGEAGNFQQKLLYDVAKKFNVNEAIVRRPPAHLTLKYSFVPNKNQLRELEEIVNNFCKNQKKTKLKLEGFGSFNKEVIFLKPIVSKEMRKVHSDFVKELKKLSWMTWKEHDGEELNFHSTIAMKDFDKIKFKKIWKYVNQFKPEYDLLFDNISIFKLSKGIWKLHKMFNF